MVGVGVSRQTQFGSKTEIVLLTTLSSSFIMEVHINIINNINVRIVIFSLLFISFQIYQHCTGYYDEPLPPQSTLESSFDNCPENILIIIIIVLKIFC